MTFAIAGDPGLPRAAWYTKRWVHPILLGICLGVFLLKFWNNNEIVTLYDQHVLLVKLISEHADFMDAGLLGYYQYPFSLYFVAGSFLLDFFSYAQLAKIYFTATGGMVLCAVYAFCAALTRSPFVSFLITFALFDAELMALPHVGANGVPSVTFYVYWVVFAVIAVALWCLLTRRPYVSTVMFAVSAAIHPMHGPLAFATLTPTAWLATGRDSRHLAFHVGVGVLTALALLLAIPGAVSGGVGDDTEFYLHTVRLTSSGHLLLDAGTGYWTAFIAFLAAFASGLATSLAWRDSRIFLWPTLLIGALLVGAGYYFVQIHPLLIAYRVLPIRITTLLSALSLIFSLAWMLRLLRDETRLCVIVPAIIGLSAAMLGTTAALLVLSIAVSLAAALTASRPERYVCYGLAGTIVAFAWAVPAQHLGLAQLAGASPRYGLPLLTAVLCGAYVACRSANRLRRFQTGLLVSAIPILAVATLLAPALIDYTKNPAWEARLREFWKLGEWISANTPSGQPILTGPLYDMPHTELTARRGSIIHLGKVAWVYTSPETLQRFDRVLRDMGIDLRKYQSHADLLRQVEADWRSNNSAAEFMSLGKKYGARCLLTQSDHVLDLSVLFRGRFFTVYQLDETREAPQGNARPSCATPAVRVNGPAFSTDSSVQ